MHVQICVYFYERRIIWSNTYDYEKTERGFDVFGQLVKEYVYNGNTSYTLRYSYDRKGRIKSIVLPDGSSIQYSYNALFGKHIERLSPENKVMYRHTYDDYDQQGRLLQETLPGCLHQEHEYQANNEILRKNDVFTEHLQYNSKGQLRETNRFGRCKPFHARYGYDTMTQLAMESSNLFSNVYIHDSLHNRLKRGKMKKNEGHFFQDFLDGIEPHARSEVYSAFNFFEDNLSTKIGKDFQNAFKDILESKQMVYEDLTYNSLQQFTSAPQISYSYDLQGNLLRKVLDGEEYNFKNNILSQVLSIDKKNGPSLSFYYDAFGRRLTKRECINGNKKNSLYFFYFGNHELGALNEKNEIVELRIPGLSKDTISQQSVAIELNKNVYVPLHDVQGNIVALVDPNTSQVVESYIYSAFGEELIFNSYEEEISTSQIGNPWRFQEGRKDQETSLLLFGVRYYDPLIGRWTHPDPLGFHDGPNPYAFVHNNPINFRDPLGLATEDKQDPFRGYFYGEVEPHCFCERHRTCKRGGDIGKTAPQIISYHNNFEQNFPQFVPSFTFDLQLPEVPDIGIGFIHGINTPYTDAREHAEYLSKLSGGLNIQAVYNSTHGLTADLKECYMGLHYVATEPVHHLHKIWDNFFMRSSPSAMFLMICHSQGAIHVRNALLDYPAELRERIMVVAIAPGGYIYSDTCAEVMHYRAHAHRDFIPRADRSGAKRELDTIVDLRSHPDAPIFDHPFQSPTYTDALERELRKYIKLQGRKL